MELGSLRIMSTIEELHERKSSGSGLENRDYGHRESTALITRHPAIRKDIGTNSADKRLSLGRYTSLGDSGHEFVFCFCLFIKF
jgi:hypothetical protein